MTLEVEATAYSGLGPGPHNVNVTGIERKQAKAGGSYFRWEFTDAAGDTATANTAEALTPGNKTGRWYSALTGKVVDVGAKYSLAECIGKPAAIFIELNPEGYPKVISVQARTADPRVIPPVAETVAASEAGKQLHDDDLPF